MLTDLQQKHLLYIITYWTKTNSFWTLSKNVAMSLHWNYLHMTSPNYKLPWKWEVSLFYLYILVPRAVLRPLKLSVKCHSCPAQRESMRPKLASNLLLCTFKLYNSPKPRWISSLAQQVRPQRVIKSKALERACLDKNPSSATSKLCDLGQPLCLFCAQLHRSKPGCDSHLLHRTVGKWIS